MAFDGNGNYQLPSPEFPFIPNTLIDAEGMNIVLSDIGKTLSTFISRDNENGPRANISWKGFKIVELAAGSADTDAVNFGQVFKNPSFVTPKAKASPPNDDNSLLLATTEWVRNIALNANLPGQSSATVGFALTSTGTTANWTSLDGRGIKYVAKVVPADSNTITLDWSEAEAHSLTLTKAMTISFSNWPTDRVAVRLLQLTNAGAFPPVISGIVWVTPTGAESSDFAASGITWQTAGRDRVILCSVPGSTPWAKVIR